MPLSFGCPRCCCVGNTKATVVFGQQSIFHVRTIKRQNKARSTQPEKCPKSDEAASNCDFPLPTLERRPTLFRRLICRCLMNSCSHGAAKLAIKIKKARNISWAKIKRKWANVDVISCCCCCCCAVVISERQRRWWNGTGEWEWEWVHEWKWKARKWKWALKARVADSQSGERESERA